MPTSAHSRHSEVVASSTASLAAITKRAQSAARSPARTSPTKSAYPGVSTKLILVPRWTTGAMASEMERSCARSDSSKSQTVEPSWIVPARAMAPAEASSVSTKVVLPEPPGPTSTTLRIRSGLLAPRSCPAVLRPPALSAMVCLQVPGGPRRAADSEHDGPESTPPDHDVQEAEGPGLGRALWWRRHGGHSEPTRGRHEMGRAPRSMGSARGSRIVRALAPRPTLKACQT